MRTFWLSCLCLGALAAIGLAAPHPPIVISSVGDLTPENGVVGGTGTPADPYVISGWEFAAEAWVGITIRNITVHLVIENCTFRGTPRGTGISLAGSPQVAIRDCRFQGLGTGIFGYQSPGLVVEGCEFSGGRIGLELNDCDGAVVQGCRFSGLRKQGAFLWRCRASRVSGCEFSDSQTGLYLDSCNYFQVEGNLARGCGWGIYLWDSHHGEVTLNALVACERGLGLYHTSSDNTVYHNGFFDCGLAAFDDGSGVPAGGNRWHAAYPVGGNYWDFCEPQDTESGPGQDLPGPDGICDLPVEVPEAGLDRYPFLSPPPGLPLPEEGGGE
jgi:parallel beta-helix repeat protein